MYRQNVKAFDKMCPISCARVRVPIKHSRRTDAATKTLVEILWQRDICFVGSVLKPLTHLNFFKRRIPEYFMAQSVMLIIMSMLEKMEELKSWFKCQLLIIDVLTAGKNVCFSCCDEFKYISLIIISIQKFGTT